MPPLFLRGKVGGGGVKTPVEHIIEISNALKRHNTRFLYVSLPLKLSVYPEIVARDGTYIKNASTLPQFRAMHLELLRNGVEVIDCFPVFLANKHKTNLFSQSHQISRDGATLTAMIIADYLNKTTIFRRDLEQFGGTQQEFIENSNLSQSRFGIFGNCNLQSYIEEGAGIGYNLCFILKKEIDYLGRKLIFSEVFDKFDEEAFKDCCNRDLVICISFLSGSFVRTSCDAVSISMEKAYKLKDANIIKGWSNLDIESL